MNNSQKVSPILWCALSLYSCDVHCLYTAVMCTVSIQLWCALSLYSWPLHISFIAFVNLTLFLLSPVIPSKYTCIKCLNKQMNVNFCLLCFGSDAGNWNSLTCMTPREHIIIEHFIFFIYKPPMFLDRLFPKFILCVCVYVYGGWCFPMSCPPNLPTENSHVTSVLVNSRPFRPAHWKPSTSINIYTHTENEFRK